MMVGEAAKIPFAFDEKRARADVWIDNAVYEIRKTIQVEFTDT